MSSGTFQRHEVKFLLNRKQRMALELAMQDHMQQDQYGESTICSLYYDTRDFRLIRRSMEKPELWTSAAGRHGFCRTEKEV